MVEEFSEGHPLFLIPYQHPLDEIRSLRGNIPRKLYRFLGRFFVLLPAELLRLEEGVASEEKFISDDAKAPNIAFLVIVLPLEDFRGHGQRSAYN